jgi:hypothetical protein
MKIAAAILVLAMLVTTVRSEPLVGAEREDAIRGGMSTCLREQRAAPENAGWTDAMISTYCQCTVDMVAAKITREQLFARSPAVRETMLTSAGMCLGMLITQWVREGKLGPDGRPR